MSNLPKIIGIAPQLVVEDVVKTAEYYRDKLGFSIIDYFLDPPVYAMVHRDGFQIHFGKADAGQFTNNASFRKISTDFIIWIPEIDLYYEEVKARGADIAEDIVQRVYGSREFRIRDCNGYLITIAD